MIKKFLNKLFFFSGIGDLISKKTNFNFRGQILNNTIVKFFSTLFSFLIVSFTNSFLGDENYGRWMAMFTFVSWFAILDFGIGGGLRNHFGIEVSKGNNRNAQKVVSTSYVFILFIIIILTFLFYFFSPFVDWNWLFNIYDSSINTIDVINLIFITLIFLMFGKLSNPLLNGIHKSHLVSSNYLYYQVILFFGILILFNTSSNFNIEKLSQYAYLTLFVTIFSYLTFKLYVFKKYFRDYIPKIKDFSFKVLKKIGGLSSKFFIIQICAMVLYSTDIFIINNLMGGDQAGKYAVLHKYYGITVIIFGLIIAPAWSAIVSAKEKSDFVFLRKLKNDLIKFATFISIINVFLIIIQPYVFKIWLPYNEYDIDIVNNLLIASFVSITFYMQIFSTFQNGFGKVNIQMWYAIFAAIANIFLTVYGVEKFKLGFNWAVFVSMLVNIPGLFIYNYQITNLLKRSN